MKKEGQCRDNECCCKCKHQYEIYPFKPAHFHQVGGYMCIGLWASSGEDEQKKTGRICSYYIDGHGICEVYYSENNQSRVDVK